jgi:hypothetical protein
MLFELKEIRLAGSRIYDRTEVTCGKLR